MATALDTLKKDLSSNPRTWLVTGAAGFIGSHLLETLLKLNQTVVGFDNFSTGHRHNLEQVREAVSDEVWTKNCKFIEGDITNLEACKQAAKGVDIVLHQAALGSVPRSVADPLATNAANVTGFMNVLLAAREAGVKRGSLRFF